MNAPMVVITALAVLMASAGCSGRTDRDADAHVDGEGDADQGRDADTEAEADAERDSDARVDADDREDAEGDVDQPIGDCVTEAELLDDSFDHDDDPGTPALALPPIMRQCDSACRDEPAGCIADCIAAATDGAISLDCAACFDVMAECTASHCGYDCSGREDPSGFCVQCACEGGCGALLDGCAGVAVAGC